MRRGGKRKMLWDQQKSGVQGSEAAWMNASDDAELWCV